MIGYAELSERWGVKRGTLMVWQHRGKLPKPDLVLGEGRHRKIAWEEDTIKEYENEHGIPGGGSS